MATVYFQNSAHLVRTGSLDLEHVPGEKLTGAFKFNTDAIGAVQHIYRNESDNVILIFIDILVGGQLRISIDDQTGANELARMTSAALSPSTDYACIFSLDSSVGGLSAELWINDSLSASPVVTAGTVGLDANSHAIGGTKIGFDSFTGTMTQLRIWDDISPDLSIEAERRNFFDVAGNDMPFSVAQIAYGLAPVIQFGETPAAAWNAGTNAGKGENFVFGGGGPILDVGASIVDVGGGNNLIFDGQAGVAVQVSGFAGDITSFTFASGSFESAPLTQLGSGTNYTIDANDLTALTENTIGCPMTSSNNSVVLRATDGVDTADFPIIRQPAAGWGITETLNGQNAHGVFKDRPEGVPIDTSQQYYETVTGKLSQTQSGDYKVNDLNEVVFKTQVFDANLGRWEAWNILVNQVTGATRLLIFQNQLNQEED